jgi:deoxyribodipyrimidine photo-lyase
MAIQVVWLKRDLRLRDHAPLAAAARAGRVLLLYVDEPQLLHSAEFDSSQLQFQRECLRDMETQLAPLGGYVARRTGDVLHVLDELRERHGVAGLWSHAETGNQLTYARDQQVAAWARSHAIPWTELPQTGVIRRLKSRDGWAARWNVFMSRAPSEFPKRIEFASEVPRGRELEFAELGLPPSAKPLAQRGGESNAHTLLESFLAQRGVDYRRAMSSPVSGWEGCSRLSPYLAWGAISLREVHQALGRRRETLREELRRGHAVDRRWLASLSSFAGRLRWRSHFMQKLEDEPALEFENMNRVYDGMREGEFDQARFAAWCEGRTGYPMVDACMRCLHASGWINFRMRAMLASFAAYHLWLHWRPTSVFLARHFLDFEPGIHFPQFQMQSGVTGINTVRIYSPAKQVLDQDPEGVFLRRWLPELAEVPREHLAEPQRMPLSVQREARCIIGEHYPPPIVDHASAYQSARQRVYARKRAARVESAAVYAKHGSRRRPGARGRKTRGTAQARE